MNNHEKYTTTQKERKVFLIALVAVILVITIALAVTFCKGEELITCYAICKPGSHVNIHMTPSDGGVITGYMECGDSFQTDAEPEEGWIPCYGVGEGGWVYVGYVSTEPVRKVGERYVCVAKKQVACRRWCNGPQIKDNKGRRQWLKNGQNVDVFVIGDEWAVTSRGYIKAEFLEADPQ